MTTSNRTALRPQLNRRRFVQLGALGLSLPAWLRARAAQATSPTGSANSGFGRAKACIVLFAWGGMSHLDTWDPKPDMGSDIRGEFSPIATSVPGIHIGEHMPKIAQRMHHLTVVRSMHHKAAAHRDAAYWNLTGHQPERLNAGSIKPSRNDWPCLGSMVSHARAEGWLQSDSAAEKLPGTITLPYQIADSGILNGQFSGFLGTKHDPLFVTPRSGTPYEGKSPRAGKISLEFVPNVDRRRLEARRSLLETLESDGVRSLAETETTDSFQTQAMDMLLDPSVRSAFEIERESAATRAAYGDHICGQSVLMARRLSEAGVPLVTVMCAAGDLNGSVGAHFDTHVHNFDRLKRELLPPLDLASAALIDDLVARGRLDDTLVVWLTEFGRTPRIGGAAGRDHFPNCYSIAMAGGGVRGGQVYGSSDRTGSTPLTGAADPADLHATIFHALGINPESVLYDLQGRPLALSSGKPLPVFS